MSEIEGLFKINKLIMDTENDKELRVYEFSYLLVPTMAEEDVKAKVDSLKKLFADNGAAIIADEVPEYIGLAYTMIHKVNNKNLRISSAYFGWFKFKSETDILEKVAVALDRDNDLVRHLLIKTVAENTMAPKKLSQKRDVRKQYNGISTPTTGTTESTEAVTDVADEPVMLSEDMPEDVMAEIAPEDVIEVSEPVETEALAEVETKE